MTRFLTLLALALLAVAEVAAVLALQARLGAAGTVVMLALDVLAGLLVMAWGMRSAPPQRGWRIAAGAVIAVPGLVLDLVGLLLLAPPVQRWGRGHLSRGTESMLRRQRISVVTVTDAQGMPRTTVVPGDVIPGQVVDEAPDNTTDRAGAPPDPGPKVVRGEIEPPSGQVPPGGLPPPR